jgi:HSP20 family molecular chaperone IbpA
MNVTIQPVRFAANQPGNGHPAQPAPQPVDGFTPNIDIHESPDGLVLEADLPGATEKGIQIDLEDNVLNLSAPIEWAAPEGARVLHQEFRAGAYQRSFILSDEVDRDAISAQFRNGVLRLVLPKAERAKTRRIEVLSG